MPAVGTQFTASLDEIVLRLHSYHHAGRGQNSRARALRQAIFTRAAKHRSASSACRFVGARPAAVIPHVLCVLPIAAWKPSEY